MARSFVLLSCLLFLAGCDLSSGSGSATKKSSPTPASQPASFASVNDNSWYKVNPKSKTTFVFAHGIFSSSQGCWLRDDANGPKRTAFWPDLVASDPRLENPSVYLGGYFTAADSGAYGIRDCAAQLFRNLSIPDTTYKQTVIDSDNIIFVCHSTGGIVVRYMLLENAEQFRGKKVGLVLMASPSLGSDYANYFGFLADVYNNRLAQQLRRDDPVLTDLDKRFKTFVYSQQGFQLVGTEAWESKFILHKKWFPDTRRVVDEFSAARYFDSGTQIASVDHFSIVKPASIQDDSHVFLVNYYLTKYKRAKLTAVENETLYQRAEELLYSVSKIFLAVRVKIKPSQRPGDAGKYEVSSTLDPQESREIDAKVGEIRAILEKANDPSVERQKVVCDVSSAVIALRDNKGEEAFRLLSRESVRTYIKQLPREIRLGTSILTIMAVNAEENGEWESAVNYYDQVLNIQASSQDKDAKLSRFRARVQYAHQLSNLGKQAESARQSVLAEEEVKEMAAQTNVKVLSFDGPVNPQGCPKPWFLTINTQEQSVGQVNVEVIRESGEDPALLLKTVNSSGAIGSVGLIDPALTPIITWEWRTDEFPVVGDLRRAETDDQSCQLVFAFLYNFRTYLFQYGWDNTAPPGTTMVREVSGGKRPYIMYYLVLDSGKSPKGTWVKKRRNLADDLKEVFGSKTVKDLEKQNGWVEIPADAKVQFLGVAVQGNTQHAGGRSTGLFRTIRFFPDYDKKP
jgi:hypothetical protein